MLCPEELRALRLLARNPAYELESRPLRTVRRLLTFGLASITERHQVPWHGPGRKIEITAEGRRMLKELPPRPTEERKER